MKSRFFGLSAKLALAAVAVGFTFTSCYDSLNENVVVPTPTEGIVLPAPSYEITGYVTDFLTGSALQGVAVATPIGSASTDATGFYKVTSASAGAGAVTFTLAGYQTLSYTVSISTAQTGTVAYTVNAALLKDGYVDGVEVATLGTSTISDVLPITTITNTDDEAITKDLTLAVKDGVRFAQTRATDLENFLAYIKAVRGISYVGDEFVPVEKTFTVAIPARSEVASVNVESFVATELYTLPNASESFKVDRIYGRQITPNAVSIDHSHGHDHDSHGHGGENSGGGVGGAE